MNGLYLVRLLENEGDDQYLCMVYTNSFENFFWQVDEQGFDPNHIRFKKINMGAITLKYEDVYMQFLNTDIPHVGRLKEVNNGEDYDYNEFRFEYDGLSDNLISEIETSKGWKRLSRIDIKNKIWSH